MMQYRTSAALIATIAGLANAQSNLPTVTTPTSLVECQPAQFTVSGGTGPYFVSLIPGGQAGAAALQTLPTVAAPGAVTWNVDIPAGTAITVQVRDSTGALNYSQQVTVQPGSDSNCIGGNASASAPSAGPTTGSASASSVASSASARESSVASSVSSALNSAVSSAASVASSVSSRASASIPSASSARPSNAAPSASAPASGASTMSASFLGLATAFVVALFA